MAESTQVEEDDKIDQEDVESGLQEIFNLTPAGLKKECNVDFKSAWPTIGAALGKLQKISDDFDIEEAEHIADDDSNYEQNFLANCRKSESFKKERKNVIKAALPCAKEDRVSELMKISEKNIC